MNSIFYNILIYFLKNVSTNVILLASLFVLSIIIYYTFNKNSLEHMDNENENENENDKIVEGNTSYFKKNKPSKKKLR
jgi:hypothetical protein